MALALTPGPPESAASPDGSALFSRRTRWIGAIWVVVSTVATAAAATRATTPRGYILMFVLPIAVAHLVPSVTIGWLAVRSAPPADATGYWLLYAGLIGIYITGTGLLIGALTGWRWANGTGIPAVTAIGISYCTGLTVLARRRSGKRALSVDVIEAVSSVVAVVAPLAVLWGPAVLDAEEPWFALPAALAFVFAIWGSYWGTLLLLRLGPGRDAMDLCGLLLWACAAITAALHTYQGVTGFTMPAPVPITIHTLCFSMLLLIPLNVPLRIRPGMAFLPPRAQVRGTRMVALVGGVGLLALLGATAAVQDDRPWAVPFSLGVVSVLFVLGAFRQMAASEETKRLYAQVQEAAEQRRRLLSQLLERSLHERRRFAGQLYEQAMAAYASFHVLTSAGEKGPGSPLRAASARVRGDLVRNAESVRGLVLAIPPTTDDEVDRRERLAAPMAAYLDTLYNDGPTLPALRVEVSKDVTLDWIAETVLLQVVQEALHNVWKHSKATEVHVSLDAVDDAALLRIADDGVGFDPTTTSERSGLTTMRAAVGVVGGSLVVDAQPEKGTTITARLA